MPKSAQMMQPMLRPHLTREELIIIVEALEAVSPSGGSSEPYRLAQKLIANRNIEITSEAVVIRQKVAYNEIKEARHEQPLKNKQGYDNETATLALVLKILERVLDNLNKQTYTSSYMAEQMSYLQAAKVSTKSLLRDR